MQKRSHKLLAATLLENTQGFQARRFELAFLFGSFQPDCNPLTYLKGSLREQRFRGHNFRNSEWYMEASADMCRDARFILEATRLLMGGCLPQTAPGLCVSGGGIS